MAKITTCLILTFLTACQSLVPMPTVIPTATLTTTPTITATPTATSTPTVTPTPTPIGITEPKIAFVGKDSQGNLGIYVDGLYTGKPETISPISFPEDRASYLNMRWSPDGKRLVFENNNELNRSSFFLYDVASNSTREITKVPGGKYVFELNWSLDAKIFYFGMASIGARQIFSDEIYHKLDLSNGRISKAKEYFPGAGNSHLNSSASFHTSPLPRTISDLTMGGMGGYGPNGVVYDSIRFFPELNAYGGLKYNEQSTDVVLITQEGTVDKTLVTFPANFGLNGSMDLHLSPDKSQILIIGDGGVWLSSDQFSGGQFVYAAQLTNLPLNESDLNILSNWHNIHAFGWSPDSMNYLIAEQNYKIGELEGRFEIIQASSGDVVYEYKIQNEVTPAFSVRQGISGYDMVWPVLP